MTQLLKEQTKALRKARATYLRAVQRDVVKYNKNRIVPEWLKPDQPVWMHSQHLNWPGSDLLGKKFKSPYVGPFTIVSLNKSKTAARLTWKDAGIKVHPVQPVSRLEEYKAQIDHPLLDSQMPEPDEITEKGQEKFTTDKLIDRNVKRRKTGRRTTYRYLVKWQGYAAEWNTWEPEETLIEDWCKELIDEYDRKYPRK